MGDKYYGTKELQVRTKYGKDRYMRCVYCGADADTREHIPPRVFQSELGCNIKTLPSCFNCNNQFSNDELYVAILVEQYKLIKVPGYIISEKNNSRIIKNIAMSSEIVERLKNGCNYGEYDLYKVDRILKKLAIGHLAYFFDLNIYDEDLINVEHQWEFQMNNGDFEEFFTEDILNAFPEIGFEINSHLIPYAGGLLNLFHKVDENYIFYVNFDEGIHTCKICISNFLFAKITIEQQFI